MYLLHLIAIPHWLTSEASLTVATWGLVVATFILYLDSRARGNQQEERWKRENQLRTEEAKPVGIVELGKRQGSPLLIALCYNLGKHPFVIDKITISIVNGVRRTNDLVGPHVVLPGTFVPVPIDCKDLLLGRTGYNDASVVFQLKGATGLIDTAPAMFNLYPDTTGGYDWDLNISAHRLPGIVVQFPRDIPPEIPETR
jgi:hypothetical protein